MFRGSAGTRRRETSATLRASTPCGTKLGLKAVKSAETSTGTSAGSPRSIDEVRARIIFIARTTTNARARSFVTVIRPSPTSSAGGFVPSGSATRPSCGETRIWSAPSPTTVATAPTVVPSGVPGTSGEARSERRSSGETASSESPARCISARRAGPMISGARRSSRRGSTARASAPMSSAGCPSTAASVAATTRAASLRPRSS